VIVHASRPTAAYTLSVATWISISGSRITQSVFSASLRLGGGFYYVAIPRWSEVILGVITDLLYAQVWYFLQSSVLERLISELPEQLHVVICEYGSLPRQLRSVGVVAKGQFDPIFDQSLT
jgi:hypothetical protein